MDQEERQALIEEVASAWRSSTEGGIESHPGWKLLDEEGRVEAYEIAAMLRKMEAALDEEGLSTTAQVVLERVMEQAERDAAPDNVVKLNEARKGNGAPERKQDRGVAPVIAFPKRVMQSQPWAMAAVALLVVGAGLLSVRERQGPGTGAVGGVQVATTEEPQREIDASEPSAQPSEPAAPAVVEEERIEVAAAEPQAPKKKPRRRKPKQPTAPAAEPQAEEEAPIVVAEAPSQTEKTEPAGEPPDPVLAPSMKGPPGSTTALSEGDTATTPSDHKRRICDARVTTLEKMVARKADYEPAPEEQLAVGRCYNLRGNEVKARYWLERATKHPDTKAAAERELRKLDAN
jgi:hypothetical protein